MALRLFAGTGSSAKFRERAEECRIIADTFSDSETRDRMLGIADEYDRMAADREQSEAADGT